MRAPGTSGPFLPLPELWREWELSLEKPSLLPREPSNSSRRRRCSCSSSSRCRSLRISSSISADVWGFHVLSVYCSSRPSSPSGPFSLLSGLCVPMSSTKEILGFQKGKEKCSLRRTPAAAGLGVEPGSLPPWESSRAHRPALAEAWSCAGGSPRPLSPAGGTERVRVTV